MSVSASKLVASNMNICFNKVDLTVNPTGHNYWATMYLLQIFLFWGSLINFLLHLNLLRNSVIQKRKNTVDSKKDDYNKLHTLLHVRITHLSSCNAAVRIWRRGDKM